MDSLKFLRHLGKVSTNFSQYDQNLLEAIPRADHAILPKQTKGSDQWTLYELSCQLTDGRFLTLIGDLQIPLRSPSIIESKSLKLYLFGLSQKVFKTVSDYELRLRRDLIYILNTSIKLKIYTPAQWTQKTQRSHAFFYQSSFQASLSRYCFQNFRSKCPVTHQPDWASLFIFTEPVHHLPEKIFDSFILPLIDRAEFHEMCITRLYRALLVFNFKTLIVLGRFTRRGGIDINPLRSNCLEAIENIPLSLQ